MSDNTNKGGLFMKIEKLTAERDAALAQNAELVAQVAAFSKALKNQLNDCINFDGGKLTDSIMEHSGIILKSTPTQCLRQIQADACRAGFIAGCEACDPYLDSYYSDLNFDGKADEYAERVAKGEV